MWTVLSDVTCPTCLDAILDPDDGCLDDLARQAVRSDATATATAAAYAVDLHRRGHDAG